MKTLLAIVSLTWCLAAFGAEVIPPKPDRYFNDFAHVTQAATADRLNKTLEDFEKQTSSQVVVAVYPKMESDTSLEDYTVRVFRAWGVGQKDKNNGAVLFVFVQEHRMRIATGYGLEGAMPDALCKQILDNEITPLFKKGDYDGGLSAGVTAMLAAAKGEYKGTGRTVAQVRNPVVSHNGASQVILVLVAILVGIILSKIGRSGRRQSRFGGWMINSGGFGGWSGGGGWGGSSGGGFGGGGGGGFSGGGGSTGGGGASGGW
jgi:uncharacterized protein